MPEPLITWCPGCLAVSHWGGQANGYDPYHKCTTCHRYGQGHRFQGLPAAIRDACWSAYAMGGGLAVIDLLQAMRSRGEL